MFGVVLGIASLCAFAAADFFGANASSRTDPVKTTLLSRTGAIPAALIVAVLVPAERVVASDVAWGVIAGVAQFVALQFLLRALTKGVMAIGAALSGVLASAVPVTWAIARGESVTALRATGICVALVGVIVLNLGSPHETTLKSVSGNQTRVAIDAALSGVLFGIVFVALGMANPRSEAIPLVTAQVTTGVIVLAILLIARADLRAPRQVVASAAAAGASAALGNGAFMWAAHASVASVTAVFPAMVPVVVALLARVFASQHMTRWQLSGIGLAVVASMFLST